MPHLIAVAVILAMLIGAGGYAVHKLRAADAREIEALSGVAEHNAATARRVEAQAAFAAKQAADALVKTNARHKATQDALQRLQEVRDAQAADDPCRLCRVDWVLDGAEDGNEAGSGGVSDGAPAETVPAEP